MSYSSKSIHMVYMHFEGVVSRPEFKAWLDEIQHLIQHKQRFLIIMKTEIDTKFPDEYRQLQSHWYKSFKQEFFEYCVGLVRIAQDSDDLKRLNTPALHSAWQVPYYVSLDQQDAMHWAVTKWL